MPIASFRPFVAGASALLAAVLASGAAHATPDFPQAVVQDLGLPSITFDAPNGCTLCHPNDSGGTSLLPFGDLLQSLGVTPYDENSLSVALAQVESDDPQLISDIKAGKDPNSDVSGGASPEYGCSAAKPGRPALAALPLLLASALVVAIYRRTRRTRIRSSRRR
jgi:hypothetical protein